MGVPEAAHPEGQQRFEVDAFLGAVVAHEAQRRTLRSSKAWSPVHVGDGSGEMFDPGGGGVGTPGRVVLADDLQHGLTADEAVAVGPFEAQEVGAAVVPVDRRPEEEDLRERSFRARRVSPRRPVGYPMTDLWCRRPS